MESGEIMETEKKISYSFCAEKTFIPANISVSRSQRLFLARGKAS
jgi:hypothetical protein